jgi:serine/threonine-protein kinase
MKKSYSIDIPVKKFWTVVVPLFLLFSAVGFIVGIVLVDRFVMPNIVRINKGMMTVPDITGSEWETARQKLFDVGLRLNISSRQFSDSVPENVVMTQSPEAGEKVKKGRVIDVVVSKGQEIAAVPDVKELSENQAKLALKKQGFLIGKIRRVYDDDVPKDAVVKLSPESGITISREMPVDIYVSDGVKPTHAEVPNIIGEPLGVSKEKIEDSGLQVGTITYQHNATLQPGTVITQSVPPGSRVMLDSKVDIVVSVIR